MALTGRVARTYKGAQDEIDVMLTSSDTYYPGAILSLVSGKATVAATAIKQQIAGIFTGETDDGDRSDAKVIGAASTIKGKLKRGKVWLPKAVPAQTDVGLLFVQSSDDTMVAVPTTVTLRYYAYECIGYDSSMGLLFDLRNMVVVDNPAV
jgi:hypothetical protein